MQTKRIGLIVPSTNTTIESLVYSGDLTGLFDIAVAVTRLKVTTIAGSSDSRRQFHPRRLLAATGLLVDTQPDSISWTGTSGLWLGMDHEMELLQAMSDTAGVPATSATIGLFAALREYDPPSVSLLTPYESPIHESVLAAFRTAGFDVVADKNFEITDNASFAEIPRATIEDAVAMLGEQGLVSVVCTNILACIQGVPIVDSTLAMLWHAIALADPGRGLSYQLFYSAISERIGLSARDFRQP